MFLRSHQRWKDGQPHTYWSLVETSRTPSGPRQRTLCYLGELNGSAQSRWLKTVEVFNAQGESRQLKLFPSDVALPEDDEQVAQVLVDRVRLERTRHFGECFLGLELWRRLELDRFLAPLMDRPGDEADVPWSRVAALLAINRLCAPGSELAIEQRWTSYIQLTEAEAAFRALKSELAIRPIFHQLEHRAKAHVMVAFLGYALWVTLKHLLRGKGSKLSPMQALAVAATLHSADIVPPTTDGRQIRLRRVTTPTPQLQTLFQQLGMTLPDRLSFDQECSADSAIA